MARRPFDEDEQIVSRAMRELAQDRANGGLLPDPSFIWWKAQLVRRFEAEREATAPLEVGDRFHIAAAVLGAVALAGGAWNQLPRLTFNSTEVLGIVLGGVVLLSVFAFAAIEAFRIEK